MGIVEQQTLHTSHQLLNSCGIAPPSSKNLTKVMDIMMYYVAKNGELNNLVRTIAELTSFTPDVATNFSVLEQAAKQPELMVLADDYSAANLWMNLLVSLKTVTTLEVLEFELSNVIDILDLQGTSRQSIYAKLKKSVDKINTVTTNCQVYYTVDMVNETVYFAISTSTRPSEVKVWFNNQGVNNNNLFDAITKSKSADA
jgi:hypothetical protein